MENKQFNPPRRTNEATTTTEDLDLSKSSKSVPKINLFSDESDEDEAAQTWDMSDEKRVTTEIPDRYYGYLYAFSQPQ